MLRPSHRREASFAITVATISTIRSRPQTASATWKRLDAETGLEVGNGFARIMTAIYSTTIGGVYSLAGVLSSTRMSRIHLSLLRLTGE